MYEMPHGQGLADAVSLLYALVGIWIAHSLYKTPRKKWQAIVAWVLCFVFLSIITTPVAALFPDVSYEKVSTLLGFTCIFVYVYLFPQIPVAQRVFTYFMVDTFMQLIVLFARATSIAAVEFIPLNVDLLFGIFYTTAMIAFVLYFHNRFKQTALEGLSFFQNHLRILAVFSIVCYLSILISVDVWGTWKPVSISVWIKWMLIIFFVMICYIIVFKTLSTIGRQQAAEEEKESMQEQIVLSEQYYGALVGSIEQMRVHNHDLKHHINALGGLCAAGKWEEVERYIADMEADLPKNTPHQYCRIGAVNALLEHYSALFGENNIAFHCQVLVPADSPVKPLHLCIIIGNALQNALEALLTRNNTENGFVELKLVQNGDKTVLLVVNSCPEEPDTGADGKYRSTKTEPGHGLGIDSIRETANQYDGWSHTEWKDGIFSLQVILKKPQDMRG